MCTAKNFPYYGIVQTLDWSFSFKGILGLGHSDSKVSPNFISSLYKNKQIPNESFTLQLGNGNSQSLLSIGSSSKLIQTKKGAQKYTLKRNEDDASWRASIQSVQVGHYV